MNYTKGVWERKGLEISQSGKGIIAKCPTPQNDGVFECVANSNLIVAAPDMYEALKNLIACWALYGAVEEWRLSLEKAQQALAKAEEPSQTPSASPAPHRERRRQS